jgi:hypothetical protein
VLGGVFLVSGSALEPVLFSIFKEFLLFDVILALEFLDA